MPIEDYEELKICPMLNLTQIDWSAPLLTANFGAGFGAGALTAPAAGLHKWTLSANLLPDMDEYSIDYEIDGDPFSSPRFSYLFEFIKRHIALNNKPFIIRDPRTEKKYLVSFDTPNFSFPALTAKIFSGGITLVQRRTEDLDFNADGTLDLDYIAPTVILNEFGGGPYGGTEVPFYAEATDNIAAIWIALYIDGMLYAENDSSDFVFEVDTTAFSNGLRNIQARARDAEGNIGYSETLTVEFLNDESEPTRVTDLTFTATGTSTGVIGFTLPTDNIGIEAYDLEINGDVEEILPGDLVSVGGGIYSYDLTGLSPDTEYTIRIRAKDAAGNVAEWSNASTDTTDPLPTNVALASAGSSITANKAADAGSLAKAIDGIRVPGGAFATNGLQLNGSTAWLEIAFNTTRLISEINVVFANGGDLNNSGEPTLSTNGGFAAAPDFAVQYWNGSSWTTIQSVTGNDKQWRQFTFSAVSTTKIKLDVTNTGGALYFLELEAWGF